MACLAVLFALVCFIHHRHTLHPMGRKRWTAERQRTLKEADWIVGWLRQNGPASTRSIIQAMETEEIELRANVLNKALRKSPFIVHCGYQKLDGVEVSLWDFDRSSPSTTGVQSN
jgi:hypothetical protein